MTISTRCLDSSPLGYPAVEPVLFDLLKWIRQPEWPVAKPVVAFLREIGPPLTPAIEQMFRSHDQAWAAQVIREILQHWPPEALQPLFVQLEQRAMQPTSDTTSRPSAFSFGSGSFCVKTLAIFFRRSGTFSRSSCPKLRPLKVSCPIWLSSNGAHNFGRHAVTGICPVNLVLFAFLSVPESGVPQDEAFYGRHSRRLFRRGGAAGRTLLQFSRNGRRIR